MMSGLLTLGQLLALALLVDDHQHRHDEQGIDERNQSVQGHAADGTGACGNVHRVEHHGEPGQTGGSPGKACERRGGDVVDVEQSPGRTLGHQQAGADGEEEGGDK